MWVTTWISFLTQKEKTESWKIQPFHAESANCRIGHGRSDIFTHCFPWTLFKPHVRFSLIQLSWIIYAIGSFTLLPLKFLKFHMIYSFRNTYSLFSLVAIIQQRPFPTIVLCCTIIICTTVSSATLPDFFNFVSLYEESPPVISPIGRGLPKFPNILSDRVTTNTPEAS